MSNLYVKSTLEYKLNTNVDLASATELKILYINPDGVVGNKPGTQVETTKIKIILEATDILVSGRWEFQSNFKMAGKPYHGDRVIEIFEKIIE